MTHSFLNVFSLGVIVAFNNSLFVQDLIICCTQLDKCNTKYGRCPFFLLKKELIEMVKSFCFLFFFFAKDERYFAIQDQLLSNC